MTVIAWDGRILAADGLSTIDDQIYATDSRKLHRFDHPEYGPMVAGCAGNASNVQPFLKRMETSGFDIDDINEDPLSASIIVRRDGRAWNVYSNGLYRPVTFDATGSGTSLAMTVLRDGGSAIEAVRFASRHMTSCGGTIRAYCPCSNVIATIR